MLKCMVLNSSTPSGIISQGSGEWGFHTVGNKAFAYIVI